MTAIQATTLFLSFLAVAGQVLIVVLLLARLRPTSRIHSLSRAYGMHAAFLIALAATLGSLFFSEIAGYPPCTLCWYQRILMYPLVVLLGMAIFRKEERVIAPYAFVLSAIGALVAGYQYLLQIGVVPSLVCAVGSVSCAKIFLLQFGYLTLPLMSLTAFLLIALLMRGLSQNSHT